MQAEQQQRILGYFIEEAQDHLDTIEQGLLKLQSTIEDPELLYEVYRAAHSVKGGAAMLGLTSIQTTAHRLEDSFKILEKIQAQSPVQVDQDLESSFLEVSDTLKALIESLSSPYGLTDELAKSELQKVEPTFDRLNSQLESLAEHNEVVLTEFSLSPPAVLPTTPIQPPSVPVATVQATASKSPEDSAKELFFRSDVTEQLREMLQLFKQTESPQGRQALSEICQSLSRSGETFDLSNWSKFINTIEKVIINPNNTYSTLAPITIKAIKQAQELVLENRETEIEVSSEIKDLLPKSTGAPSQKNLVNSHSNSSVKPKKMPPVSNTPEPILEEDDEINFSFLKNWSEAESTIDASKPTPKGPEIAAEELKSLADLFEGENSIGYGWQSSSKSSESDSSDHQALDLSNRVNSQESGDLDDDFLDLFNSESEAETNSSSLESVPEVEAVQNLPQPLKEVKAESIDFETTDFDDLLNIGAIEESQPQLTSNSTTTSEPDSASDGMSFDDLFATSPAETPPSAKEKLPPRENEDLDWFENLVSGDVEAASSPNLTAQTSSTSAQTNASGSTQENSDHLFNELFGDVEDESTSSLSTSETIEQALTTSQTKDFGDLETFLNQTTDSSERSTSSGDSEASLLAEGEELFSDLDALLEAEDEDSDEDGDVEDDHEEDHEFAELGKLIGGDDNNNGGSTGGIRKRTSAKPVFEQTAKVPVKQLDNLSNLMGELVVNRNSLEQDQERMRQFLDNLLDQVSLLSDVGQRMQDFYERSLLEISLLSGRKQPVWNPPRTSDDQHPKNRGNDAISRLYEDFESTELDRFTPFHTLSQEIIELVVRVRESAADIEFLVEEADQVSRQLRQVTTQLEEGLTKARMEPFAQEADRLARPVRDISIKCGKQAQLHVEGRDTLIDKMLLGKLHDPLIHLVNNAITHGIEPEDVRDKAGKPANGRIMIKVFHQGNQTVIAVSDDGAGIDVENVKAKAIRKGLVTPERAASMSNIDVYDLLFHPGFSMREQADEYAGRGVGMDVVRTSLNDIRGTITTDSTLGRGTTFTIRLPLNMSISRALCCISDRARIAFPMDGVEEMIDIPREQIRIMDDGKQALEWRGSLLPFRHLRELLTYKRHLGRGNVYGTNTEEDMISVIVLRSAGTYLAVMVDQVLAEQEIVIKQLEGPVPKPVGIAGATVLGDGQIVAIADVLELIDLAMGRIRKEASPWPSGISTPTETKEQQNTQPTVLIVDDSITVRSLLSITFEKSGYRVEEARDGKEAWEKLKSGLPCDLVFCDIEMPRMDGLELLSRMQKDPALIDLPIAMLTSRGADRHRQMAYQLGASGYFTKPYLEEQLLEAAGRMLNGEVVGKPPGVALPS
ncbi:MAG: response regulator [Cyanobacteria bacterium J06592_8]